MKRKKNLFIEEIDKDILHDEVLRQVELSADACIENTNIKHSKIGIVMSSIFTVVFAGLTFACAAFSIIYAALLFGILTISNINNIFDEIDNIKLSKKNILNIKSDMKDSLIDSVEENTKEIAKKKKAVKEVQQITLDTAPLKKVSEAEDYLMKVLSKVGYKNIFEIEKVLGEKFEIEHDENEEDFYSDEL